MPPDEQAPARSADRPLDYARGPTDSKLSHTAVRREIYRHWKQVDRQAQKAHAGAYNYKVLNAVLGWASIALAGTAAVVAVFGDVVALTAATAGGAAIASAVQKTIEPARKARLVRDESIEWEGLATKLRHFYLFESPGMTAADALQKLEALLQERRSLDKKYIGTRPQYGKRSAREIAEPTPPKDDDAS